MKNKLSKLHIMKFLIKTSIYFFIIILNFYLISYTFAASGPIAQDFGADDWLDKLHIIYSIIFLVVITTFILVFLILRKK